MIRPYWFSEDRWAARGLLLAVVLLTLGMVYVTVLFNQWNNAFFSALQDKNQAAFLAQLFRVSWLLAVFILLAVYQTYLNQMLEIRWRRWLTDRYLSAWLADAAYYRMQLVSRETDNPDQRIAEDVQLLVSHTLGLSTWGLRALVTLATFLGILWSLSGTLTFSVGGFSITLPGYMVWVALLYAIAGTWFTDWIGRPLVRLNFDRQRYEADFRFSLVRFRENTEGVALYRGEADEFRGFRERFEEVARNWWGIMRRQKRLTSFTSGYGQAAWIVPSVVAAPRYFRGELGLGGLMQTTGAFQQVQDSLSFFIQSYKEIAAWRSVVERLAGFERALERVHLEVARGGGVRCVEGGATHLTVEGVDLHRPDGQPLMTNINLSIQRGDTVLLGGASGSGKSTLVRAIAGIWPFGRGEIRTARGARVLFLPQRPYLPIGTLREVVSYPMPAGGVDDATLIEALDVVGLPELAERLDDATHWALQLSPGEQQRIAFARALVQKPDWLFLDEATAAVDEATEALLYRLLRERLPGATVFSIGHRATLRPFHARLLLTQLNGSEPGSGSIVEVPVTPDAGPGSGAPRHDREPAEPR
jgi:putative ATP-binding cassette transporter